MQKILIIRAIHYSNNFLSNLTHLPTVCKLKCICYGPKTKNSALCASVKFGRPSNIWNVQFSNSKSIQFLLNIRIFFGYRFKSFDNRGHIFRNQTLQKGWYDEPPQNLPITEILGEQAPPVLISKSERPYWQGFNWFLILAIFHLDFIIVMLKFICYIKIEFFRCYYTILIKARTL